MAKLKLVQPETNSFIGKKSHVTPSKGMQAGPSSHFGQGDFSSSDLLNKKSSETPTR